MTDREQGDDRRGNSDGTTESVSFDHFDWRGTDTPSVAVAEAVAAVTNKQVTALPPLQDAVDADALDAVVASGAGSAVRVRFAYAGTDVTVAGDGQVVVATPSD